MEGSEAVEGIIVNCSRYEGRRILSSQFRTNRVFLFWVHKGATSLGELRLPTVPPQQGCKNEEQYVDFKYDTLFNVEHLESIERRPESTEGYCVYLFHWIRCPRLLVISPARGVKLGSVGVC